MNYANRRGSPSGKWRISDVEATERQSWFFLRATNSEHRLLKMQNWVKDIVKLDNDTLPTIFSLNVGNRFEEWGKKKRSISTIRGEETEVKHVAPWSHYQWVIMQNPWKLVEYGLCTVGHDVWIICNSFTINTIHCNYNVRKKLRQKNAMPAKRTAWQ